MAMSPLGLEIKNDCAGEDQQQFTRRLCAVLRCIASSRDLATTIEQREDFLCALVVVIRRVCKSVRLL
jgi:hypothetical protein